MPGASPQSHDVAVGYWAAGTVIGISYMHWTDFGMVTGREQ